MVFIDLIALFIKLCKFLALQLLIITTDNCGPLWTISCLLMGARTALFVYESTPDREWIVEYTFLSYHHLEIEQFFRWERTTDGFLRVSAILDFQQRTRVTYHGDGMLDLDDDVGERTTELKVFLHHHDNDDSLPVSDMWTIVDNCGQS